MLEEIGFALRGVLIAFVGMVLGGIVSGAAIFAGLAMQEMLR